LYQVHASPIAEEALKRIAALYESKNRFVAGRLTSAGRFAISATATTGIVPPLAE
jgi:hypothetical protein